MTVGAVPAHVLSPPEVYAAALRQAATGGHAELTAVDPAGRVRVLPSGAWCADVVAGDQGLLRRCDGGPTLDSGCGPGRLAGNLARRGRASLGIDVNGGAVRLACRRGAPAVRRDVFAPLPGEGCWRRLLLADGSIGIDGHPRRLLRVMEVWTEAGRWFLSLAAA